MTNDAPDRVWPDRVWLEDEFGEGDEDQFAYGSWDCRNVYGYEEPYLRATPARERAEELVHALNQARLAFAGYVSADSAIRKIDNLLASLEQEEGK
jgi:hypothetical protein